MVKLSLSSFFNQESDTFLKKSVQYKVTPYRSWPRPVPTKRLASKFRLLKIKKCLPFP